MPLCLPFVAAYEDGGLGLLGDPTRRAIFELLARRPCSVQQLADQLPISRPAVSQHLRVLKDGGLVVSRAEGTRRIYQLNPEGVTALRAWLDGVWSDALAGFHKAADAAAPTPDDRTGDPMTATAPIPPITGTVTVGVPIDQAFAVFTGSIDTWWPHEYHIGQADVAEVILEPREGGRWYERGVDGSECDWGRVLVWEPPHRLVFTWQINGRVAVRPRPRARQRDRGPVHRERAGGDHGRGRAPPLRPARSAARPSTTRSAAAADGRCCSTASPRPWRDRS